MVDVFQRVSENQRAFPHTIYKGRVIDKLLASGSRFYQTAVLARPRFILVVLALLCLFFAYFSKDFKLDASADSLLLENDQDLKLFRQVNERYETRDFLFVTVTPKEPLFSDFSLNGIRALRDELSRLEQVESVISILDVPLLRQYQGSLSEVVENYRTLEQAGVDRRSARQELLESPMFSELIISRDGMHTALLLNLKTNEEYFRLLKEKDRLQLKKRFEGLDAREEELLRQTLESYDRVKIQADKENHRNIAAIRALMQEHAWLGTLHLGGVPMIADDMISFVRNDLFRFGVGVLLFLIGMLSIIFRQVRWVVLPLLSCIYAGLVMVGLLGLVGWRVTVISSNFISLMLILTMSMNVHLVVRYRELQRDRPDADNYQLLVEMTRKMVWPCLYTALTTMIGFGSLFISDIKPVIDFGWMMTIGLMVTFLTTFLLFPAILSLLGKAAAPVGGRGASAITSSLAGVTQRHGNKVLIFSIIFAVISIVGMTRLKVENSFINYFSKQTEIYQGQKLIDEKLGGTTPLDIILRFDAGNSERQEVKINQHSDDLNDLDELFGDIETEQGEGWFVPYKLELIKKVHRYLAGLHEVGKVQSLASFLWLAEELNKGQPFDAFELALIYKRMPEELRGSLIDPYLSLEENEARITLRIVDSLKDLRRNELLERIRTDLAEKFGLMGESAQLTGLLVLYNNMLKSLFRSQILTLGAVMTGIALMLLVLFRSVPLAVIGIIPNILAALTILGLMGLMNVPLDMMTITIAAITIGIAVDDCIHYIYRFREEFHKRGDYLETMNYCHANIGRAMFYTSITIIIGFSILVVSNFIPTIYFGLLTTLAMFIALLAALTLLPKLILVWRPF